MRQEAKELGLVGKVLPTQEASRGFNFKTEVAIRSCLLGIMRELRIHPSLVLRYDDSYSDNDNCNYCNYYYYCYCYCCYCCYCYCFCFLRRRLVLIATTTTTTTTTTATTLYYCS